MSEPTPRLTADQVRAFITDVLSEPLFAQEDPEFLDTIRVLLASLFVGMNGDKVASFLKLNRDFVRVRAKRLREQGIWRKQGLAIDWFHEKCGHMSLVIDALVAEGKIERASWDQNPDGTWGSYVAPEN